MSAISQFFDGLHGVIFPFAGSSAPGGFLLCYGQAVSRATYAALFSAIGTTHGTGDGSTTFNIPDLRGRTIAGKDNMGGAAASRLTNSGTGNPGIDGAALGAAGGVDRHTLTEAQMPQHTHTEATTSGSVAVQSGVSATVVAGQATQASGPAGSDNAHPIMQPTMVLNWIIKT